MQSMKRNAQKGRKLSLMEATNVELGQQSKGSSVKVGGTQGTVNLKNKRVDLSQEHEEFTAEIEIGEPTDAIPSIVNGIVVGVTEAIRKQQFEAQIIWKELQTPPSASQLGSEVEEEVNSKTQKRPISDDFHIAKLSNAGYKLEYVAPLKLGELQMVEIEIEDIKTEIVFWSKVVNGVIVVRFNTEAMKQEVLQGGIYHFDNKPFIVNEWMPELEFTREELSTVPIWIKFPRLDFKYWSIKGLNKIASLIGRPLMVDHNT
ncbi:hypothetical protein KY289_005971 [Solanum tuberosum]|nr:hypothetical protein KY289_005971 [Solanum tuberosum]